MFLDFHGPLLHLQGFTSLFAVLLEDLVWTSAGYPVWHRVAEEISPAYP
jgi:hypothetical protein